MEAIEVKHDAVVWTPASRLLGDGAIYDGAEVAHQALLSDRRGEGGGIAYLLRLTPPSGKLVRIVAIAQSDENAFILEGGYCNKLGELIHFPGDYILNPQGHPHSAFVAIETKVLVICRGEPDQVVSFGVVERIAPERAAARVG